MSFDINFSSPAFFPLLFLLLALLFTWFVYRRTTPPVGEWLRRGLAAFRVFALALALLLLFEPIVNLAFHRSQKPVVAVLVDNSASMSLSDSGMTRGDIVKQALARPWLKNLDDRAEIELFSFSDSLRKLTSDSLARLRFDGDGSNLSAALLSAKENLSGQQLAAVVLLSDGANNLGANPLRIVQSYGAPIITLRMGAGNVTKDVLISEVVANEVAYAGARLPIEVIISATGFKGRKANLILYEKDKEVAREQIELPADNTQTTAKLSVVPKETGLIRFTAHLEELNGELTGANNHRVFYVRVLKSKLNLRVFAGSPSADYSFLARALAADSNFQVTGFVQRPGGNFYRTGSAALPAFQREETWEKVDGIILVDFPRRDSNRELLQMLASQLTKNGKPLFYLHGASVDVPSLWQLRGALPLTATPATTGEKTVTMRLEPAGFSHPLARALQESGTNGPASSPSTSLASDLPPLFSNLANLNPLAGAEVLASAASASGPNPGRNRSEPIWIAQRNAARKTMAVFAYGLWRWSLLLQGVDKNPEIYGKLVTSIVRWMVTTEDSKLVRVESNKEIYRGGEQIELLAQVYQEDYRPLEGAQVKAQLSGPQFSQEVLMQDVGNGLYRAQLQVLGGGEYEYRGTAESGGRQIGEDSGRFSVEPFSMEFLETRVNQPLLREVAKATGGSSVPADSLDEALQSLPMEPVQKTDSLSYGLWGRPSLLIVLVLALCAEWFIRKRQGML